MALQRFGDPEVDSVGPGLRARYRLSEEPGAAWRQAFRDGGALSIFAIWQASFHGRQLSVELPREQDLAELTKTVDRCIERANQQGREREVATRRREPYAKSFPGVRMVRWRTGRTHPSLDRPHGRATGRGAKRIGWSRATRCPGAAADRGHGAAS
jgi:hypothetical protein